MSEDARLMNRKCRASGSVVPVESTTPVMAISERMSVAMPLAGRLMSRFVPANALTRCFVTTTSPDFGATYDL